MKKVLAMFVALAVLMTQFFTVSVFADDSSSSEKQYRTLTMQDFESEAIRGDNFKMYTMSTQTGLLDGEYGKGSSTAPTATVSNEKAYEGEYSLSYKGRDRDSARIKIAHILPEDISPYVGKTIKITAKIMLSDYTDATKSAKINFRVMSDKDYGVDFASTFTAANPDEWTDVSMDLNVTSDCIVKNPSGSITYPLRVAVETSGEAIPKAFYIDNLCAQLDVTNEDATSAFQGFETENTVGTDINSSGEGSITISANTDKTYVRTGNYSAKASGRNNADNGLRVLNLLKKIAVSSNIGKTFKITAYVMPVYTQGDLSDADYAKNLKNLSFRMVVTKNNSSQQTGDIRKIGLNNNEWNKMTLLYPITQEVVDNAIIALRFDQYADGAVLCPDFYVDDISVEEYTDFYSPSMAVEKTEGYEDKTGFTEYSVSSYNGLLIGDYRLGGDGAKPSFDISKNQYHTGSKSLRVSGLAQTSAGKFSNRVKLANLLPDDIENYVGYKFKVSAYVMAENYTGTNAAIDERSFSIGFINDKDTDKFSETPYQVNEGEWTLMQSEFEITRSFIETYIYSGNDKAENETRAWPLRPMIQFSNDRNKVPSTVYIDDITVEYVCEGIGVTLPKVFANDMILQRNKPVPVWGWDGTPGDVITAEIDGVSVNATVDSEGKFYMELPALSGGKNKTLTIKNGNLKKVYTNVGIGEVWYCSGQSNMELKISQIFNKEDIINIADQHDVRTFKIPKIASYDKQQDLPDGSEWKVLNSSNVSNVSAIAYISAYQIEEYLGVPVAIIECYDGGSSAQAWLSYDKIFAADRENVYNNDNWRPLNADGTTNTWGCSGRTIIEDYEFYKDCYTSGTNSRYTPTAYYNTMQYPLAPYAIAGVMWYQGESQPNARLAEQYNYILYDLINQWREDFKDADLPVMLIQLAPYSAEKGRNFFEIRQAQLDTHKRMKNVGVIATANEGPIGSTNGDTDAIHPKTKIPVGNRLAATINAMVYSKSGEYSGPEFESMTVSGNKAILSFSHIGDGLRIKDNGTSLTGFKISYDGTSYVDATAEINGDKVEVYTSQNLSPVGVQYCYVNVNPATSLANLGGNLENSIGYPAFPFIATLSNAKFDTVTVSDTQSGSEVKSPAKSNLTSGITVTASITEKGYNTTSQKVIAALYENGNLVDVKTDATSFTTRNKQSVNFNFKHTANDSSKYEVKVFLWNSYSDLAPIDAAQTINFN